MPRAERDKGARGEREVADLFRERFACERVPNSGGLFIPGDLTVIGEQRPSIHVEVKRQERLRLPEWLAQARDEAPAGSIPVVCFRQNREEWFACLPLRQLIELL